MRNSILIQWKQQSSRTNLPSTLTAFSSGGSRVQRCSVIFRDIACERIHVEPAISLVMLLLLLLCGARLRYRPSSDTNKLSPNASNRRCSGRAHNEMLPTSLPHHQLAAVAVALRPRARLRPADIVYATSRCRPAQGMLVRLSPVAGPGTQSAQRTEISAAAHQCVNVRRCLVAEAIYCCYRTRINSESITNYNL